MDGFNTWQEKTEWVQKDKRFDVLLPWGKHRADVMKEYIDPLEVRCAALAAENACLKQSIEEMAEVFETGTAVAESLNLRTSETDAFLAEVRARGVDALVERRLTAARLAKESGHEITARDLEGEAIRARFFAMEIRKGVKS